MTLNYGELILGMPIWKPTPMRSFYHCWPRVGRTGRFHSHLQQGTLWSQSSGKRWAERFYDIIKDMGFTPSKGDSCIWMRENQKLKCYENVATCVDDYALQLKTLARHPNPQTRL